MTQKIKYNLVKVPKLMTVRNRNLNLLTKKSLFFIVVELLSYVWLFWIPWTAVCQYSLSFTVSQSFVKFISIESVMLSNLLFTIDHSTFPPRIKPCDQSHFGISVFIWRSCSIYIICITHCWTFCFLQCQ